MTIVDKNIIDTYSKLFDGLEPAVKTKLMARLSKPTKTNKISKEEAFYNSFGSFPAGVSAEKMIEDIKSTRNFNERDLSF